MKSKLLVSLSVGATLLIALSGCEGDSDDKGGSMEASIQQLCTKDRSCADSAELEWDYASMDECMQDTLGELPDPLPGACESAVKAFAKCILSRGKCIEEEDEGELYAYFDVEGSDCEREGEAVEEACYPEE
jgi:hypothetical protein